MRRLQRGWDALGSIRVRLTLWYVLLLALILADFCSFIYVRLSLLQLTINLVDNAIKYTPPGGTVTITTRSEPGWAILEVADTGPGVKPEHRERIFERFFRADSARSRGNGTGLGLAISRWIAEAHGGDIRLTGGSAGGSTFWVRLPVGIATATHR